MRTPRRAKDGFGETLLPYLDAAFNLARWLASNQQDAEEIVQEAMVKALRYQDSYRGGDLKAWLLTIVRNTAYSMLQKRRSGVVQYGDPASEVATPEPTPEAAAMRKAATETLHRALGGLPAEFREVVVLRELEGLSYKDIAEVTGAPIGTVMSRLSRARALLKAALAVKGT